MLVQCDALTKAEVADIRRLERIEARLEHLPWIGVISCRESDSLCSLFVRGLR
jgi:hypothetical protein